MLTHEELLRKATGVLTVLSDTVDFGGAGQAPLSVEQVTQFIELMQAEQIMLREARTVTSSASKWQESIIDFGVRIARPGTESTRLTAGNRVIPTTGLVEISTVLIRGEVPVSDETFEDNVAAAALAGTLERMIADQFGFDIEDLMVNGDTGSGDSYLALIDGWLKQAKDETGNNSFDASSYSQDYQEIFKQLLIRFPKRFLRNIKGAGRYFVPVTLEQKYRDLLATRGTALGDFMLTQGGDLAYQGVKILGAPSIDAGIVAATPDTTSILLSYPKNLYAGYHRVMRFETYRDPREGVTSFVITARVDAEVAVVKATSLAHTVNIEP